MKISILLPYKENYSPDYLVLYQFLLTLYQSSVDLKKIFEFMDQQTLRINFQIIITILNFQKNFYLVNLKIM